MLVYFFFFILWGDLTLRTLEIYPTLERDLTETFERCAFSETHDTVFLNEILEAEP